MIDFLRQIFTSKPAKVFYMFVLIFGWAAALVAGIAIPVDAGYSFWAIPIAAAVLVSGPTYLKALKWCLN